MEPVTLIVVGLVASWAAYGILAIYRARAEARTKYLGHSLREWDRYMRDLER